MKNQKDKSFKETKQKASLWIPSELRIQIKVQAARESRTFSDMVCYMAEQYFEKKQEDEIAKGKIKVDKVKKMKEMVSYILKQKKWSDEDLASLWRNNADKE